MNSVRLGAMALVLTLVMAGAALAQSDYSSPSSSSSSSAMDQTATGTIVSASGTSLVVRSDTGETYTFALNSPSDLPTGAISGTRVSVDYRMQGSNYQASHVELIGSTGSASASSSSMGATSSGPSNSSSGSTSSGESQRLPGTASPLGLLALGGLGALGTAAVLRAYRGR